MKQFSSMSRFKADIFLLQAFFGDCIMFQLLSPGSRFFNHGNMAHVLIHKGVNLLIDLDPSYVIEFNSLGSTSTAAFE